MPMPTSTVHPDTPFFRSGVPQVRSARGREDRMADLIDAIRRGRYEAAIALIQGGTDVGCAHKRRRWTALHWAASRAHPRLVSVLLQHGARVDAENKWKRTPLLEAIGWKSSPSEEEARLECVKVLLQEGANVRHCDEDGDNALHYACQSSHLSIVKQLLIADLSLLDVKNKKGKTPSNYAEDDVKAHIQKVEALLRSTNPALDAATDEDLHALIPVLIEQLNPINALNAEGKLPCDITRDANLKTLLCPYNHESHRYKRVGFIADGSFGQVDKVQHKVSGKLFARKLIKNDGNVMSGSGDVRAREVRAMKGIHHHNVVMLEEFWMERSCLVIIMELCEVSLDRWLLEHELREERDVRKLLLDTSAGLAHIHENNLIHRDLKPNNILVNGSGDSLTAKIGDLGLAVETRNRSFSSSHTAFTGNKLYRAPENCDNKDESSYSSVSNFFERKGKYTNKIDVYSLGLIWSEILIPMMNHIEKDSFFELMKGQFFRARPLIPHVERFPREFDMIQRMLESNYRKRPTSSEVHHLAKELQMGGEKESQGGASSSHFSTLCLSGCGKTFVGLRRLDSGTVSSYSNSLTLDLLCLMRSGDTWIQNMFLSPEYFPLSTHPSTSVESKRFRHRCSSWMNLDPLFLRSLGYMPQSMFLFPEYFLLWTHGGTSVASTRFRIGRSSSENSWTSLKKTVASSISALEVNSQTSLPTLSCHHHASHRGRSDRLITVTMSDEEQGKA
ncbi:unnamed protein product [Cyprideis torosa]|uniref:Uncharacterized protein n=1 Tax=Cyprideis torosa TaxID=163714 RepID=A0A7R8WLW0_9CRUS|nr:unnamed protein product [Cyprideis torosa]CAG0898553.1 unnamed protein product [Cyprideis torosa]